MDKWNEMYNNKVFASKISVHINDRTIIVQVREHITMKVFPTSDDAIIAATALGIGFREMEKDLKRDFDWLNGI